jgi:hypothetical protein
VLSFVIGPFGGTSQDDMCRVVTVCLDNGGKTLLGNREEGVTRASSFDGVDRDVDRPVLVVSYVLPM